MVNGGHIHDIHSSSRSISYSRQSHFGTCLLCFSRARPSRNLSEQVVRGLKSAGPPETAAPSSKVHRAFDDIILAKRKNGIPQRRSTHQFKKCLHLASLLC